MKKYLLVAFIILTTINLFSQAGTLDNNFGVGGKVTTDFAGLVDRGNSVATQSDGKIVVAGFSLIGTEYDFALARYNTNGSLDNSFGTNGKVTTDFESPNDYGRSLAIQSDGKILVAGQSYNNGSDYDFALVRYNANGSLDKSFSQDGKVTTPIGGYHDFGNSIAIQSDGKIVLAGGTDNGTNWDFALVRYHANGNPDSSFGTNGKVTTDIGSDFNEGYSVAIQSNGKIVVAGYSGGGASSAFALVRYNPDGTLDNSFNTSGKVVTDLSSFDDIGNSLALQSDGKIVVAGYSSNGSDHDFALVRYNVNGSLDNFFNTNGKVFTDFGSKDDVGSSVVIQNDGRIVVVGNSNNGSNNDFALARYNANGSLDNGFSGDGKVTTNFSGNDDYGYAVALQSDGKIAAAGYSYNGISHVFALARYNIAFSGIENVLAGTDWVIAPNPSNGIFTIQKQGKVNDIQFVEVYNVLGELVYSTTSEIIDIADSPIGIYFVKISDGENVYSLKLVKE